MTHDNEAWHPLSAAQHSMWRQARQGAEAHGWRNITFCVRILNELGPARLQAALNELARKHPILRLRFREIDGEPSQAVDGSANIEVSVFDLGHLDKDQLDRRLSEDTVRPFEPTKAPLVRAGIYRGGGSQCILLLVFDHLICDGWSFWRLIHELGELLDSDHSYAPKAGPESVVEVDYFAYVQEQERWLRSPAAEKQLNYWRTALVGEIPAIDLPTDRPRSHDPCSAGDRLSWVLPSPLSHRLRELAKRHKITLYVVLLSAYFILLHQLTGKKSIAVGSVVPARGRGNWAHVAGLIRNRIYLHASFDPTLSVQQLLRQVQSNVFGALRNQDYPFDEMTKRLCQERSTQFSRLYQNLFVFQNARGAENVLALMVGGVGGRTADTVRWGGCEVVYYRKPADDVDMQADLELKVIEFRDEIVGALAYSPSLFDSGTIERWFGYWVEILEAMISDDGQAADRIVIPGALER